MRNYTKKFAKRGFTLIEAIVSIALFSFAIAGPMSLAAHSLNASANAKNELIATHLAEEGVEAVIRLRDYNSATDPAHGNWMNGILGPGQANCPESKQCTFDITGDPAGGANYPLSKCQGNQCNSDQVMYYNPQTGLYRQSSGNLNAPWVATNFSRLIQMTSISAQQVRVTVTVTYVGFRGITKTITISDDLYNWFPYLN